MVSATAMPSKSPAALPSRRYCTYAEYPTNRNAAVRIRCHSHHDSRHLSARVTASIASASSTNAVTTEISTAPGARRYRR